MYHIRCFIRLYRTRKCRFSTKKVDIKSIQSDNINPSTTPEVSETHKQEYISPLYTQKVGMFTKPGVKFSDDPKAKFRLFKFYVISIVSFIVVISMVKVIPPGHVGLITRKDGKIDQFKNNGRSAIFYIPFVDKPFAFRITPIRKKIIRTCSTLDSKQVEVVIFLTLTAKEAFASHIFSIFGVNFTNGFVEKELNFDIDQVVKKFKLDELILTPESIETLQKEKGNLYTLDSSIEKANSELIERFEDAGSFNKIEVTDVNISYRRPDLNNINV